jgi:L-methionine (R)-S-oxide reductase
MATSVKTNKPDSEQLQDIVQLIKRHGSDRTAALAAVMRQLSETRADYHWVGIYKLDGDTLVLGPYVGPHTDHDRIPVGRGVCGTAVAENKNQIVSDVRALTNYLACNLETRSEIVVLIRDAKTQKILGQIDVDGTKVDAFKHEERFLESVATQLAPLLA